MNGDYSQKRVIVKFYRNGHDSRRPKYITQGQALSLDNRTSITNQPVGMGVEWLPDDAELFAHLETSGTAGWTWNGDTFALERLWLKNIVVTYHQTFEAGSYETIRFDLSWFDYTIGYSDGTAYVRKFNHATGGLDDLDTQDYSSDFDYIKLYERDGTVYIQHSADGEEWVDWVSSVESTDETTVAYLRFWIYFSTTQPSSMYVQIDGLDVSDRYGNLLAIETNLLGDFSFSHQINTPASSTTLTLPYDPRYLELNDG